MRRGRTIARLLASAVLVAAAGASSSPARSGDDVAVEVTPRLVAAVDRGLAFLASQQLRDGAWIGSVGFKLNQDYTVQEADVPHVGVTALAGMAFLAGGHLPDRGPYGDTLTRAIAFLIAHQNDQGFITHRQSRMYDHAFATLFLAEVFGQTESGEVRTALQRAVDLIKNSQNPRGSWRYQPFALESDMSITVCQLMALRAARNVGIRVPAETINRAVDYVEQSRVVDESAYSDFSYMQPEGYYALGTGAFRYQYQDEDMSRSSFALTAAGITSLYHAAKYDSDTPQMKASLEFLTAQMRRVSSSDWRCHFFYWYGHYYAAQAMFITGDPWWKSYWRTISGELLETGTQFSQGKDGAWPNPVGPGRNFSTAVACIVLQVPFRYLPILQR
ncbi:MAG: prenyltransferase [Planctomycetes bacterium]|nr:prenyltransferase [Planctomycetota bacterium]